MKYEGMWVGGDPKTKGSWIPMQTKAGIKFRPATKGASKWYKDAARAIGDQWDHGILEGPIKVRLLVLLPRKKTVKRKFPISKFDGDVDKLVRAIFDAMTGIVYGDDSQVVDVTASKRYADNSSPGVWVYIDTKIKNVV